MWAGFIVRGTEASARDLKVDASLPKWLTLKAFSLSLVPTAGGSRVQGEITMTFCRRTLASVALAALSSSAFGQSAPPPPSSVPVQPGTMVAVAGTGVSVLRTGTPVQLKMAEDLTTKNKAVRVGQRFRMEVAEDVKVDGQTVIPIGSPAVGEITDVRNKGMWGKSGHLGAQVRYVQVNGRQIRLTGTFDDKGVTGTAGVVAAVALIPVAGFFTTGTSAKLPMGAPIKAFVDEDVALAFAPSAAQAPLVITPPGAQAPTTSHP